MTGLAMILIIAEIVMFVGGLCFLVTGRARYEKNSPYELRGLPARVLGLILMAPVPLSFAVGIVAGIAIGIVAAVRGQASPPPRRNSANRNDCGGCDSPELHGRFLCGSARLPEPGAAPPEPGKRPGRPHRRFFASLDTGGRRATARRPRVVSSGHPVAKSMAYGFSSPSRLTHNCPVLGSRAVGDSALFCVPLPCLPTPLAAYAQIFSRGTPWHAACS